MQKVWRIGRIYFVLILLLVVNTVADFFIAKELFVFSLIITLVAMIVAAYSLFKLHGQISKVIAEVSVGLSTAQSSALNNLRIPVIITASSGEIVWYNPKFERSVPEASMLVGQNIDHILDSEVMEKLGDDGKSEMALGDKIFKIYETDAGSKEELLKIYYLIDITKQKKALFELESTRPVVGFLAVDNIEEIAINARESDVDSFKSEVQRKIEHWCSKQPCIFRKLSSDRYIIVTEEKFFSKIEEEKFSILSNVRELKFGDNGFATMSIGIGRGGKTFAETEEMAAKALDMAFGRGGDQAVVAKPDNEYKFYGGLSSAAEKRTKVRVRIIASALKELIMSASNVIVMGHSYADLDSLGSSVALASAVHSLGKEVFIVMNPDKTMSKPLYNRVMSIGASHFDISDGNDLFTVIDKGTLLIITDVHRAVFLENPKLYEKCENVVVIDHHRKAVDHISDAVIFYHETAVSSACEMVTELLQYMAPKSIGQIEAEALLSGIMLDSRNFVLNTGVRTFEASAYLRNKGADPVTVKKLFSGSLEAYREHAEVVAGAKLYDGDCAIAFNDHINENTKMTTAQAADELLGISGVLASFVLCKYGGEINISARSFGGMNVQVIMEKLGGGGHRTMAAAQLKTDTVEDACVLLKKAIDEYKSEIKTHERKQKDESNT